MVADWYEKTHAGNAASRVLGVKQVINDIKVDWGLSYSDAALVKKIKSRHDPLYLHHYHHPYYYCGDDYLL